MSETEPSAPLPERRMAWRAIADLTDALAAATERATRAERERDEWKRATHNMRVAWREATDGLDQARAQLAKVRGVSAEARAMAAGPLSGKRYTAEHWADRIDAALGPVGATEGEAGEGHPCGHETRQRGCGGCDPGAVEWVIEDGGSSWRRPTSDETSLDVESFPAPASPAAAEPERDVPFRCRVCGWVEGEAP